MYNIKVSKEHSSVGVPFHVIRIRILLRIRPKIEEMPTFFYNFFLLITQKIIYYNINIENINSNEKKF